MEEKSRSSVTQAVGKETSSARKAGVKRRRSKQPQRDGANAVVSSSGGLPPHHNRHRNQGKRRKNPNKGKERNLWIVKCPETSLLSDSSEEIFTVWITRVELTDDHGPSSRSTTTTSNRTLDRQVTNPLVNAAAVGSAPDQESLASPGAAEGLPTNQPGESARPTLITVRRCASSLRPRSHFPSDPNFQHLPNGDNGDGIINPHPDVIEDKFWSQRKRFFTKFDEGIQLDRESWYSVTPEAIATYTSRRMTMALPSSESRRFVVLDPFGGAGGNTIAFCRNDLVDQVVHVDTDLAKIHMAANNCRVYGIPPRKIMFLHANGCQVLMSYRNGRLIHKDENDDVTESPSTVHGYTVVSSLHLLPPEIHAVFLSPPWGGPDVVDNVAGNGYVLENISVEEANGGSVDGEALLGMAHDAVPADSQRVAYYLPRSANGKRFAMSAIDVGFRGSVEFEENVLNCKLKTITAYLGQLVDPS